MLSLDSPLLATLRNDRSKIPGMVEPTLLDDIAFRSPVSCDIVDHPSWNYEFFDVVSGYVIDSDEIFESRYGLWSPVYF